MLIFEIGSALPNSAEPAFGTRILIVSAGDVGPTSSEQRDMFLSVQLRLEYLLDCAMDIRLHVDI